MNHSIRGCIFALSSLVSFAQDAQGNERENPRSVIVKNELIEISLEEANQLFYGAKFLRSGKQIRKEVDELIIQKKAKLLELTTVIAALGTTTRGKDVVMQIYPTEWDPPEVDEGGNNAPQHVTPPTPTAFEERAVGSILEVTPTLVPEKNQDPLISLKQSLEVVSSHKAQSWMNFKANNQLTSITMPSFTKHELSQSLTLADGKIEFTGMFTGKDEHGNITPSKKILHFTTANIITLGK